MADQDAPYLDPDPPVWAARALAWVLLALALVAAIALVVVQVPETVSAPFTVVAQQGADPVRSLHDGTVSQVLVTDAQHVDAGAPLFVVTSETVGDRMAERESLGASLSGGQARLANERRRHENQRRADEQELARLEQRAAALRTQATLKDQQWTLAGEVLKRQQRSQAEGLTSWMDVSKQALEVDRLAVEREQTRADLAEISSTQARLRFEMASRQAAFEETTRSVDQELAQARSRKGLLDREDARTGNELQVTARCAGTITRLVVRRPGTVVAAAETLAEMTCDGETLQAELLVPERGMARVAAGQPVKLQYDAFPYQRYGVRYATIRWISPASSDGAAGAGRAVRLLADLADASVRVGAATRPVLPGMSGQAAVIVGRRTLASYAFEPLRQMREALADAPPAAPAR
ncbi:MAG: HlyD family efflux transporter periplasmic adaptor subunit [Vicinamibacterales bacterium]